MSIEIVTTVPPVKYKSVYELTEGKAYLNPVTGEVFIMTSVSDYPVLLSDPSLKGVSNCYFNAEDYLIEVQLKVEIIR